MNDAVVVHEKHFLPLLSADRIRKRVVELGARLNADYADRNPLFVAVLNGAFVFAADLMRTVTVPSEITFVKLASYQGSASSGVVEEILGLKEDLQGRHVIIVEDIVDTGLTMADFIKTIREYRPTSVAVATLLFKPTALRRPLTLDYVGFEIENRFVVGYGLDYDGQGRNLPAVYQLA